MNARKIISYVGAVVLTPPILAIGAAVLVIGVVWTVFDFLLKTMEPGKLSAGNKKK